MWPTPAGDVCVAGHGSDRRRPAIRVRAGRPWEVFSEQSPAAYDDLVAETDVETGDTPLRSALVHPLGEHGVLIAGAPTPGAFSDADVSVARMLAANVRSAFDRVARERTLRERTDALEERNTALERVERVNGIIRGITGELIRASTREEVLQAVCDRLAEAAAYRFAWSGSRDAVTGQVAPEASAGAEEGFLEAATAADGSDERPNPTAEAIRTREPRVENALAADPPFEPWRRAAVDRGFQACIAVPLVYQDVCYGVLTLYADRPNAFHHMEATVLGELGEIIGYALNALERKQALVGDRSVALEFRLRDGDPPLFRFATDHGWEFEFENVVRRSEGSPGILFTVRGVAPDAVLDAGRRSPEIEDLVLVREDDDGALFECRLRDSAFLSVLLDRGAMPRTFTATDGEGHAVIRVAGSSNVRTFVELFETQYERVDLIARREVDEPVRTRAEFEAEYRSLLTDRQEEILRTAYAAGFFSSPRGMSAQELAERLDVSQPTVSRHIRAGERKLFGLVFDDVDDG